MKNTIPLSLCSCRQAQQNDRHPPRTLPSYGLRSAVEKDVKNRKETQHSLKYIKTLSCHKYRNYRRITVIIAYTILTIVKNGTKLQGRNETNARAKESLGSEANVGLFILKALEWKRGTSKHIKLPDK